VCGSPSAIASGRTWGDEGEPQSRLCISLVSRENLTTCLTVPQNDAMNVASVAMEQHDEEKAISKHIKVWSDAGADHPLGKSYCKSAYVPFVHL
jgi:hypothetical protein